MAHFALLSSVIVWALSPAGWAQDSGSTNIFRSRSRAPTLLVGTDQKVLDANSVLTSSGNVVIYSTASTAAMDLLGIYNDAASILFVVEQSGEVGIGTRSPGNLLHVEGTGTVFLSSGMALVQSNSGTAADDVFDIRNQAGTAIFTVEQSGEVGIGTTNPGRALSVEALAGVTYISSFSATGRTLQIYADSGGEAIFGGGGTIGGTTPILGFDDVGTAVNQGIYLGANGGSQFFLNGEGAINLMPRISSTTLVFDGNAANVITVVGGGKVGIGDATADASLEVAPVAADTYSFRVSSQNGTTDLLAVDSVNNEVEIGSANLIVNPAQTYTSSFTSVGYLAVVSSETITTGAVITARNSCRGP